jgi:hypothetical protein
VEVVVTLQAAEAAQKQHKSSTKAAAEAAQKQQQGS